ncbi:hypothetical protein BD779DRAFT_1484574 [Infundibulicybe gibba]|nr:hypothetical protein BD779DRAFT_1484574 [Infundibulicybe gibba]
MATTESNIHLPETTKSQPIDVDSLVDATAKASLQDETNEAQLGDVEKILPSPPPIRVYTRTQLLALHNSPLVKPPVGMPDLKDWFGAENEQSIGKKDSEQSTPNNARERRFKNADDGDTPSRTTFRASLTQPSQMGNFKHQSLRGDRERDRDGDKDRERDMRDKEGQERLRSLSDKYDRERLALPSSNSRNKDRDAAPHLTSTSSKLNPQAQASNATSRRTEAREAAKKKAGETSEDWRRGAEPRPAREDRSETGRRDRDEREHQHPRSHPRETSRSRGEPSAPGRDRDDKEKERDRRGERDREFYRRERDDYRRDRDRDDRDLELDDPRRWRDDGKREERLAARRTERNPERHPDREHRDRDRVRERAQETAWDVANDRDGRGKRGAARERKAGTGGEDVRERDDRRDRDREPAWMDTYIPNSSSAGILGSKGADGELDGIQAWKKGMKEKEERDKGPPGSTKEEKPHSGEQPLDEIQFFKILMKREEEKKQSDTTNTGPLESSTEPPSAATKQSSFNGFTQPSTLAVEPSLPPSNPSIPNPPSQLGVRESSSASPTIILPTEPPHAPFHHPSYHDPSKDNLQILTIPSQPSQVSPQSASPERGPRDSTTQFNPPPGSRLLALARTSSAKTLTPTVNPITNGAYPNAGLPQADSPDTQGQSKGDSSHPFSPFEEQGRLSRLLAEEQSNLSGPSESNRRVSAERPIFASEAPSSRLDSPSFEGNGGYTAPKGSRFAKFFDGKNRDTAPSMIKNQNGLVSTSPAPGSRPDQGSFNGSYGPPTDHRALDDIFAMLNTSAQNQRLNTAAPAPGIYNQQNHLHLLQQQQLHQHQQHQNSRLEPLYESRLDDRNFMPDGMVPGLRSAPPPPRRDNLGMFPDPLDDSMHFSVQRLPQQTRGLEQLYSGPSPPIYSQQGRNPGLAQPQFRGGPSPIQHASLQNLQQQRLPPGLANLGGRPPHEPSQFINIPGLPSGSLHGPHQQPQFANFPGGGALGFGGGPQIRTQIPSGHQLQNPPHHPMSGLGPMNNMDLRTQNQNQLLGLGPIRGLGAGYNAQQGIANQMQPPMLGLRQQQQQQQLHPHIAPHLLPPHLQQQQQQQQQSLSGSNNQPAHDLMALLMGGPHRE